MPVSTRYADTTPEAMEVFLELQRKMTAGEKLRVTFDLCHMVLELAASGVRQRHPQAGEREVFLRTAALHLPRDLMLRAYGWHPSLGTLP